jgi:hypothetical protein
MMNKMIGIALVLLVGGTLLARDNGFKHKTHTFKLGTLYSVSPTGKRYGAGIKAAVADNSNVEHRARAVYDFLNKYWVHSIVILYEETEFGKRAETAFHSQLKGLQKKRYVSLMYDSTGKGRNQIRQILEMRPEAVGIFGDRNNITHLYRSLKTLNTGCHSYLPITFSIIDGHSIQGNLHPWGKETVSITGKIVHKLALIWNIFGIAPFLNILLIIIVGLFLTISEMRRWYVEELSLLFTSFHFWILLIPKMTITLAIYFYLGETGKIRYDSVLAALILSVIPSAVFRITFFYDHFLLWVHNTLISKNRRKPGNLIDVIADNNSKDHMRKLLEDTYKDIPARAKRIRMQDRMKNILRNSKTDLDARKALARLLVQHPARDDFYLAGSGRYGGAHEKE